MPHDDGGSTVRVSMVLAMDHADTREMLALLFEARGYRVVQAHDVASATEAIECGLHDAAIVDLGVANFEGLELARRVRGGLRSKHVALVAVMAWTPLDDPRALNDAGFDACCTKPTEIHGLEAVLVRACRERGAQRDAVPVT